MEVIPSSFDLIKELIFLFQKELILSLSHVFGFCPLGFDTSKPWKHLHHTVIRCLIAHVSLHRFNEYSNGQFRIG